MNANEYRIQSLVFPTDEKHQMCRELFYRGNIGYLDKVNQTVSFAPAQFFDFVTYLNACSYSKWKMYTCVSHIKLYLDIEGVFDITLVGYTKINDAVERKDFLCRNISAPEREIVCLEFPENDMQMIGFEINTISSGTIYSGYYSIYAERENNIVLAIATTTHRKEEFIKKNVSLIKNEILESEDSISDNIYLHVVDNGRTLEPSDVCGKNVFLHPNPNAGGAGGFARGMIEGLRQERKATHILLMDDDVLILPESIRRTYNLLRFMKDEYKSHFISGAMLYWEEPFRQHEDIGTVTEDCYFISLKAKLDHRFVKEDLINESHFIKQKNEYAGWWYCCIPTTCIESNGLPLPIFIRCDDMEYSLRCNAKIITMNGICIWHMGFPAKYNAVFDKYQQCRNLLIDKACSDILKNVDVYQFVLISFRNELFKFNYNAADLILDALEDYLKGPKFLYEDRGESIVKRLSAKNDKLVPIDTIAVKPIMNVWDCYGDWWTSRFRNWLRRITDNGHRFIPYSMLREDIPIIAFDHTYQQGKVTLQKRVLAVNPYALTGIIRSMDRKRYKEIKKRFYKLRRNYQAVHLRVENEYKSEREYITSVEFWDKYLKL